MSSQLEPIQNLKTVVIKECFACRQAAVFTITRQDRTLLACNNPDCIQKVDDLVISLCAMDSRGF